MKRRPLWSDRCKRAAALVCGLFFLNFSGSVWAASTPARPAAVNAAKQAKKQSQKTSTATKATPKKSGKASKKKNTVKAAPTPVGVTIGLAEMRESEETGLHGAASFYGHGFQGRRVATGERFDVRAFTGASNHFPLGSWVAVRRLDTARCAIVKINDRMHSKHQRRIIDVSRAVASYLDMLRSGVILVRVAPLKPGERHNGSCQAAFDNDSYCPECNQPPRLPVLGADE